MLCPLCRAEWKSSRKTTVADKYGYVHLIYSLCISFRDDRCLGRYFKRVAQFLNDRYMLLPEVFQGARKMWWILCL